MGTDKETSSCLRHSAGVLENMVPREVIIFILKIFV